MKFLLNILLVILLGCQSNIKENVIVDSTTITKIDSSKINAQIWCMYKRIGFRGDTLIKTSNKIIVKQDSIVTYTINDSIIFKDLIIKIPHYPNHIITDSPNKYRFPNISINDSLNILIHYSGGQDGDEEFYKLCN